MDYLGASVRHPHPAGYRRALPRERWGRILGLAHAGQWDGIREVSEDFTPERLEFRSREFGVTGEDPLGVFSGVVEEVGFAGEVGKAELGQSVLARAEELARAPEPEVDFGDFKPGGGLDQGLQAGECVRAGGGGERVLAGKEQAVGQVRSPADAAAELVELGQAEAVGIENGDDGRVGHVDTDFDDGGGQKHIGLAGAEGVHDLLLLLGGHLAVEGEDAERLERAGCKVGVGGEKGGS